MPKEFYSLDFINFLKNFGEAGKFLRDTQKDKYGDFLKKAADHGLDEKTIAAIESGENRNSGLLLGYAKSLGFSTLQDVTAAASLQTWRTELQVNYFIPGTALRRLRLANRINQSEFSTETGVSAQVISALPKDELRQLVDIYLDTGMIRQPDAPGR